MSRPLLLAFFLCHSISAATQESDTVPLFFIPNQGQSSSPVRFMVKGSGLTAHLLPDEIQLRMSGRAVSMRYEGANPRHRVEGDAPLPGRANFLTGDPVDWHIDLPMFGSVVYRDLYPGIDLAYAGEGRNLKSEFRLAAGADVSLIRVRYLGAGVPWVDAGGSLVVPVDGLDSENQLREQAPVIYQVRDGVRQAVNGSYLIHRDGTVGFRLGAYDASHPLIIDPTLSYSTLLGGSGLDSAMALAVDASGSAYVAGFTDSINFPATNPAQSFSGGGNDVFVAKLNPAGTALMYCTYLGGTADDRAFGIAVDAQGAAYITGSTTSKNFPLHSALQTKNNGYKNAFVVKLSPAGNSLVYSTYLGGNASDAGNGIAVDAAGAAYVVGDTTSFSFPATGFQRGTHGGQDAFLAKLSSDGSRLVYSTYLGGSSDEHGAAIAVDSGGAAWVTGSTSSVDFPVLHAAQQNNAGGQDAFVAHLSADGNYLLFSTYLGGSGGTVMYPEMGQGIALDGAGNVYIAGVTSSLDFPLVTALQTNRRGVMDAFVTKLNAAGTLVYSTYLGGSSVDVATAIAVDFAGAAYIGGYTISTDLPVPNAVQSTSGGDYDAFLARISPAGDVVQYLSYIGGNGSDAATAVALDAAADVYLAGYTLSTNFPLHSPYQANNAGNYGAFVAKVDFSGMRTSAVLAISSTHTGSFTQGESGAYTVLVSNQAGARSTSGTVTVTETLPDGLTLVSMSGTGWICAANNCTRNDPLSAGASYPAIAVTVNVTTSATSPQVNSVTVSGGSSVFASTTDSTSLSCGFQLSGSASFGPLAGNGTVTIAASSACGWTAVPNAAWLHITSAASGSGNGQVVFSVDANPASSQRSSALTVGNQSFPVLQGGSVSQAGAGLRFVPATPCRIADTRNVTGPFGGPAISASANRDFSVLASACGIPATAQAYALNLTVVPTGVLDALYVWPAGQPRPLVPNLSSDGRIKADMAIIAAGVNGAISVAASSTTQFVLDINGYFVPATGASDLAFYPVTPCRISDTRNPVGALGGPSIIASQSRSIPVLSSPCNIPATAKAYSLNVTVVPSGIFGFLSIWPSGNPQPLVSTLNALTGAITANASIVPAGAGGALTVIASDPTQLVIDINGYFAPPGEGGMQFYPQTACRILDTRNAAGPFGGPMMGVAERRDYLVTGSNCAVPITGSAYLLNATAIPPASMGFLSLWGAGSQPLVSTLNAVDSSITMNAALVPAGSGGTISVYTASLSHVLLDISGYFAP